MLGVAPAMYTPYEATLLGVSRVGIESESAGVGLQVRKRLDFRSLAATAPFEDTSYKMRSVFTLYHKNGSTSSMGRPLRG